MSERGAKFNHYQRDFETSSWQDLPVYLKEIVLTQGNYQEYDKRVVFDHSWVDLDTDDAIYVACHSFSDAASLYMVEINKGNQIDQLRKYAFTDDDQVINVYDANSNRLEDEQSEQLYLESYLLDRMRTSGVRDFEISHDGDDQFWSLAARDAVLCQAEIDDTIRASMCAPKEVKLEYRKFMVENIAKNRPNGIVPRRFLFQALTERENQIITSNQLESWD